MSTTVPDAGTTPTPQKTTASPGVPAAPTGLQVTAPKKKTALVTWQAAAGAVTYQVRISKKGSTRKFRAWKQTASPAYKFGKLTKKGKYVVQVRAVGRAGTGPATQLRFKQAR